MNLTKQQNKVETRARDMALTIHETKHHFIRCPGDLKWLKRATSRGQRRFARLACRDWQQDLL